MKRALVLSGGGAKGAYEIGVWKALRRLNINFDIVTGTSVGALNAMMVVQKEYYKALEIWRNINYSKILSIEINGKYSTPKGKQEIIMKYTKGALKGGLEVDSLNNLVDKVFNQKKFILSNIEYGIVTTHFPSFKPEFITKKNSNRDNIKDYLIASASCFPAFKPKKIGNDLFIDGGYYDNLPINLAIDLGATEVIAVNLGAVGLIKKPNNKDVPVTMIKPNNDLGNFLAFEKDYARYAINLGYNDTMKKYDKLEGFMYTFKKGSLNKNYIKHSKVFYEQLNIYVEGILGKTLYKKIIGKNKEKEFNRILEKLAFAFNKDQSKIYRTSFLNISLRSEYNRLNIKNFNSIKKAIKNNKLNKAFISKEIICYIYNEILSNKKRAINNLAVLFPDSFLCALYLKTIMR